MTSSPLWAGRWIAGAWRMFEVIPASEHEALRDAARLVVDAEYRREQWGSDTVATFDRAIQALRESLK